MTAAAGTFTVETLSLSIVRPEQPWQPSGDWVRRFLTTGGSIIGLWGPYVKGENALASLCRFRA